MARFSAIPSLNTQFCIRRILVECNGILHFGPFGQPGYVIVLQIYEIFLSMPLLRVFFSCVHGQKNQRKNIVWTEKLTYLYKCEKNVNLALNCTFLSQNRLKRGFSNLNVLQKGLLMQDCVFILGCSCSS